MGLFDWLKTETRSEERHRPSPYEMASRIASTIDGYIDMAGFKDFEAEADGMFLIVTDEDVLCDPCDHLDERKRLV
jgi:hypothetical protein